MRGMVQALAETGIRGGGRLRMAEATDEELMAAVGQGDRAAFQRLALRSAPRALALAIRMLGSPGDAEEVVQEALLRTWTEAPRWTPRAAFATWLHKVVSNLCVDRLRRRPMLPMEAAGDPADPSPDPARALVEARREEAAARAIADLPERQRLALTMTYFDGLPAVRVAGALGTSVGAVEGLLSRAKESLRRRLEEE